MNHQEAMLNLEKYLPLVFVPTIYTLERGSHESALSDITRVTYFSVYVVYNNDICDITKIVAKATKNLITKKNGYLSIHGWGFDQAGKIGEDISAFLFNGKTRICVVKL